MPNWKKVIVSGSDAILRTLNVDVALTASGLIYPASDNGEESFMQTDGNGNLSLQYVKTVYEEIVNGESTNLIKGTPVYVSGSVGAAALVFRADPSNPSKMPVVYIAADTLSPAENGRGIALGLIKGVNTTGFPAGTEIYVAPGGGWTSTRPTGSAIVQVLGYVTKEGAGGQGVVLNPGPVNLPNLPSGSIWVGNSSSVPTAILTSSLSVASASFAQTASFLPPGTYAVTASWAQSASNAINAQTASFLPVGTYDITASNAVVSINPINVLGSNLYSTNPAAGSSVSAVGSIFLGVDAGRTATDAFNSNFLGQSAGVGATDANNSNFLGNSAGVDATNANDSNFLGNSAGNNANNAANSNFLGNSAGNSAVNASDSNFLGQNAGFGATDANNSNFLGESAGFGATDANNSNFLGAGAGQDATAAFESNFLGSNAGNNANNAFESNFLGVGAGQDAINAFNSNFLGASAGRNAVDAYQSNFLGINAGLNAPNAYDSNFLGASAGEFSTNAANSNFLGFYAGYSATSASYSTLIGYQVGYNVAGGAAGVASNNIIIGTNITLPNQAKDSINLGAIIFATGSYNTLSGNPFSGSMAPSVGRVGINKVTPLYNLDVSGSGNYSNGLTITGSTFITGLSTTSQTNVLTYNSTTGQVFFTASSAIGEGGGGGSTVKAGSGSAASFGGSPLTSSITFGSAFSDNLYAVTITGEDARSWTIQNKSSTGFTVNSNSSTALTGPVYWIATPFSS
jgi:hypothetical protein